MTFTARYAGKCPACGGLFDVGTPLRREHVTGKYRHEQCDDDRDDNPPLYATTRRDQHAPHLIAADEGEAWDRLCGKSDGPPTPTPTRGCPYHPGQPRECPICAREARAAATPERIRAIRAAARNHQEEA